MFINYNGQILPADQPIITASNRAFHYGDGLFETIRVFDGRMPFFQLHWNRLEFHLKMMKIATPSSMDSHFFKNEIEKLTAVKENWRVRLSVWRAGGGLYSPESNLAEFLIEATPLAKNHFEINEAGLSLGTFGNFRLPIHPAPFAAKTANALPQVLASIFKSEKQWDDCLILNNEGRIACASSANIFLVKQGEIITPEVEEGCISGTMRSVVISLALLKGMKLRTSKIQVSELESADEIFLTNAIQGIRWVKKIEGSGKEFTNEIAVKFLDTINKEFLSKHKSLNHPAARPPQPFS